MSSGQKSSIFKTTKFITANFFRGSTRTSWKAPSARTDPLPLGEEERDLLPSPKPHFTLDLFLDSRPLPVNAIMRRFIYG